MPFDQAKYIADFKKKNYDEFQVRIDKKDYDIIRKIAQQQNMSLSQLVIRAIEKTYMLNLSKDDDPDIDYKP